MQQQIPVLEGCMGFHQENGMNIPEGEHGKTFSPSGQTMQHDKSKPPSEGRGGSGR